MKKNAAIVSRFVLAASSIWCAASCAHHGEPAGSATTAGGTHDPDRLKDFYLAEKVEVRGLGVTAALAKLDAAYRETCRRTGETPLKLAFEVPPGNEAPLRIRLQPGALDHSIRHVGIAARMEVERHGATYRFKVPPETGRLERKSMRVPPDLLTRLAMPDGPAGMTPRGAFAKFGVDLGESTRLSFFPSSSRLDVESRSAADMTAVYGTIEMLCRQMPVQQALQPRVFEIAAGSDWIAPGADSLDPRTAERVFDGLVKRKDVRTEPVEPLLHLRDGEQDTVWVNGGVLRVKAGLVGIGHELQTAFSGPADIRDRGYVRDSATRLSVKTRPDGSRVVFALTPTLVDATGRPVDRVER